MSRIASPLRRVGTVALAVLLQACANVTSLSAPSPGTTLAIRGVEHTELPRSEKLESKATGQYEFMATTAEGKTFYGLLPLRVNGQNMAASILFFAPALFVGGFRDVFSFYQVDPEANVVNYKVKEDDEWRQYKPTSAESKRAKAYFESLKTCPNGATTSEACVPLSTAK